MEEDDNKKQALMQLGGMDNFMDKLDTPGRAMRSGIDAYQKDQPVWDAVKAQFGDNHPPAPSGADLAETFGEQHDVQNPYALTALATLGDIVDPTMLTPAGTVSKLPKAAKAIRGLEKVRDASTLGKAPIQAKSTAELMKVREILSNPEKYGNIPEFQKAIGKTGPVKKDAVLGVGEDIHKVKEAPAESDDEMGKLLQFIKEAKERYGDNI